MGHFPGNLTSLLSAIKVSDLSKYITFYSSAVNYITTFLSEIFVTSRRINYIYYVMVFYSRISMTPDIVADITEINFPFVMRKEKLKYCITARPIILFISVS